MRSEREMFEILAKVDRGTSFNLLLLSNRHAVELVGGGNSLI